MIIQLFANYNKKPLFLSGFFYFRKKISNSMSQTSSLSEIQDFKGTYPL